MIDKLLQILERAGAGPDELADILWLASHIESEDSRTPPRKDEAADPSPKLAPTEPGPHEPAPTPGNPLYPASHPHQPVATGERHGVRIRVRRAASLSDPLAIMRALRPLGRRPDASGSRTELDEEATIAASVDQRMLLPVLRPVTDRWLNLTFVVDTHPSMVLWHDLVRELRRTFVHTGLFRTVRTWYLEGTRPDTPLAVTPMPWGTPHSPYEIVDPTGHQLILLVTDTVADRWNYMVLHDVLRHWSTHSAVAMLDLLPERLWDRGAINPTSLLFRALTAAAPNASWNLATPRRHTRRGTPNMAIPIVDASPHALSILAQLIAGNSTWHRLACLPLNTSIPDNPTADPTARHTTVESITEDPALTGPEVLARFRERATPTARELAGYLSAVPLTLPVMNLVRQVMLPHADMGHLAEVALSGILTLWDPTPNTDPERLELQFLPTVREALLGSQLREDITTVKELVRRELSTYLTNPPGTAGDFPATQATPTGNLLIPDDSIPFAETAPALSPTRAASPEREYHHGSLWGDEDHVPVTPEDSVSNRPAELNPGSPSPVPTHLDETGDPRRYLLTCVVGDYSSANLQSLPRASSEKAIMVDFFQSLGYTHVPLAPQNPIRSAILKALHGFIRNPDRRSDDQVVLYLYGHGTVSAEQECFFLSADASYDRMATTALSVRDLSNRLFDKSVVRRYLVIANTSMAAQAGRQLAEAMRSLARPPYPYPSTLPTVAVLASTGAREQSRETGFARAFVQAVRDRLAERPAVPAFSFNELVQRINVYLKSFAQQAEWVGVGHGADDLAVFFSQQQTPSEPTAADVRKQVEPEDGPNPVASSTERPHRPSTPERSLPKQNDSGHGPFSRAQEKQTATKTETNISARQINQPVVTRLFLSWAHQDRLAKDALLADLRPALDLLHDVRVEWWEDSHLTCGEELLPGIVDRLEEVDYGLLLLSNAYFANAFIREHELPKFVGADADKGALPVLLKPLPRFGPEWNLMGVEQQLVFTRDGMSFAELSGSRRTVFANDLAASLQRRLLGLNRIPVARLRRDEIAHHLTELQSRSSLTTLQSARLTAILDTLGDDGRFLLRAALDAAEFPAGDTRGQEAFQDFRRRVNRAAAEAEVELRLELEPRKVSPDQRYGWFTGGDLVDAGIASFTGEAAARTGIAHPILPEVAELGLSHTIRVYVSVHPSSNALARKVDVLLRQLREVLAADRELLWEVADPGSIGLGEDLEAARDRLCAQADVRLALVTPAYLADAAGERRRTLDSPGRVVAFALSGLPDGPLDLGLLHRHDVRRRGKPWDELTRSDQRRDYIGDVVDELRRALRPSRVIVEDRTPDGPLATWSASLARSKRPEGSTMPIAPRAAETRLRESWLDSSGLAQGPALPAVDRLVDWARDGRPEAAWLCALLGEFGTGKTTTVKLFTQQLLELRAAGIRAPLPILFDLRDIRISDLTEGMTIDKILATMLEAGRPADAVNQLTAAAVRQRVAQGNTVVVFDGLDEILVHLSPHDQPLFTRQLWRAVDERSGSKMLLTCRPYYFQKIREETTNFLGEDRQGLRGENYLALLMLPPGREQIRDV
jgi:NACHT domain/Caspase domain